MQGRIGLIFVVFAVSAMAVACGGKSTNKAASSAGATPAGASVDQLVAIGQAMYPQVKSDLPGDTYGVCGGGHAACPVTARLQKRFDEVANSPDFNANPICRCQNGSDSRSISVEAKGSGGTVHVSLFRGSVNFDLIVINDGGKLLVDDQMCTDGGPETSIYKSPQPCSRSATGSGTPVPGATTGATPRPLPSAVDAATQAAVAFFNGAAVPDFAACQKQSKPCITHGVDPDSPDKGIAAFEEGSPQGGAALVVFGQQADKTWGFWFGTQQDVYHALVLPAQMRVCADGQGANVREQPDEKAKVVTAVRDGTMVTAETFVLTNPGSNSGQRKNGNGWYSVSSPAKGFVRADFVSVARLPDCKLRDFLVPLGG